VVLAALGALGVCGVAYAMVAAAGRSLPIPSFTAGPRSPTLQTSASFGFVERGRGPSHNGRADRVVLQCSFAHALFTACSSPVAFSGLKDGWHTFRVRAMDARTGELSGLATYRWLVDRQAPSVRLVFPVNGGSYDQQQWQAGCPHGAGVCGHASDPSGVRSVAVSIRQGTANWWGGRRFDKTREFFIAAAGTENWRYALAVPMAAGPYTVRVRATDGLGNTTRASSPAHGASYLAASFTILAPPAPKITAHPSDPSSSPDASFQFTDSEAAVTFACRLDAGAWKVCSTPAGYSGLGLGRHTFDVAALDAAANTSAVAAYAWTIAPSTGTPFTITGDAPGALYPGAAAQAIAVTVHNPNNAPIQVTSVTAALASSGLPSGCQGGWFQIVQSSVSTATPVQVPANGSVTLPAQAASAPTIAMIDSGTVQNACEDAHITITYTGSAHS
jgi:hypothetical protein